MTKGPDFADSSQNIPRNNQFGLIPVPGGTPVEFRPPVSETTRFLRDNQDTRLALIVLPNETRAGIAARYNSAGSLLNDFERGLDINNIDMRNRENNLTGDQVKRALERTRAAITGGLFIYPVAAQDLIDKQADAINQVIGTLQSRTSWSPLFHPIREGEDPQTYAEQHEYDRERYAYVQGWAFDIQGGLLGGLSDQLTLGVQIFEQGYFTPEMAERVDGGVIEQINRLNLGYMHNIVLNVVRAISAPSIRIIDLPETHQRLIRQSAQQLHDAVSVVFDHDPVSAISMLTVWRNNLRSHNINTDPNSVQVEGSFEVSNQFVRSIVTLVQKIAGDVELQPHLVEIGQLIKDSLHFRTAESENIFQILVRELPLDQLPPVFIQNFQELGELEVRRSDRQIERNRNLKIDEMDPKDRWHLTLDDWEPIPNLLSLQKYTMIAVIRLALHTSTSQEKFDSLIEKFMDVYLEISKLDNPDVKFSDIADEAVDEIEVYLEEPEREKFSSYAI